MQGLAHAPAHDLARVHVDQHGKKEPTFAGPGIELAPAEAGVRSASQTWFDAVAAKFLRSLFGGHEDQETVRWTVSPRGGQS